MVSGKFKHAAALSGLLSIAAAAPGHAAVIIWIGPVFDGSWDDRASWSVAGGGEKVPGRTDTATIEKPAVVVYDSAGTTSVGALAVTNGSGLTLSAGRFRAIHGLTLGGRGAATPIGALRLSGGALAGTNVYGAGKVLLGAGGSLLENDTFADGLTIDARGGSGTIGGSLSFTTPGTIFLNEASKLAIGRNASPQTVSNAIWETVDGDEQVAVSLANGSTTVFEGNNFRTAPQTVGVGLPSLLFQSGEGKARNQIIFQGQNLVTSLEAVGEGQTAGVVQFVANNIRIHDNATFAVPPGASVIFSTPPNGDARDGFVNVGRILGNLGKVTINAQNFLNQGAIAVDSLELIAGKAINAGSIAVGKILQVFSQGANPSFVNEKTLSFNAFSDGDFQGGVLNKGTFDVGTAAVVTFGQGYEQTSGVLRTAKGAEARAPGGSVVLKGGLIEGDGEVGPLIQQGGVVKPGNSPGTLTVDGDYQQDGGVLRIDVAGPAAMDYGQLLVAGQTSLAGRIDLDLLGGFTPTAGETFTILSSQGGLGGVFADAPIRAGRDYGVLDQDGYRWKTTYVEPAQGAGAVTLSVLGAAPAPEPQSWTLFGAGALALGAALRSRARARRGRAGTGIPVATPEA